MLSSGESSTSSTESCSGPENDLQLSRGTALGLSMTGEDLRCFDHFRHHAIQDFASLLDADLWQHYILRISTTKPAVRHALLALSAQHELFLKDGHTDTSRNLAFKDPIVAYSWKQYTQAIQQLHHGMDHASSDRPTTKETIVTCLLLIFFEVLRGNYPTALMHLEAGLQIFSSHYPSVGRLSITKFRQNDPMKDVARIFKRLDIQASSYLGDRIMSNFSVPCREVRSDMLVLPSLSHINMGFVTIQDARDALDDHVAHIYQFMRSTAQSLQGDPLFGTRRVFELKYDLSLHSGGAHSSGLANIFGERQQYLAALRAWAYSFEAFLERSTSVAVDRDAIPKHSLPGAGVQQCAVLWLSYLVTLITLSTCIEPDETSYDDYRPQFQEIVTNSRSILHCEGEKIKGLPGRRISLEMSVIHPLFITAFKCRDPTVRRHAISLLRISGQEGVWNGKMLASIAEHVVEYEESQGYVNVAVEGLSSAEPLSPTLDIGWVAMDVSEQDKVDTMIIPEFARVHGVHPDLSDPGTGSLWLEYSTRECKFSEGEHERDSTRPLEKYEWIFHKAFLSW